eukprot:1350986-Amphidinium_carterae.1
MHNPGGTQSNSVQAATNATVAEMLQMTALRKAFKNNLSSDMAVAFPLDKCRSPKSLARPLQCGSLAHLLLQNNTCFFCKRNARTLECWYAALISTCMAHPALAALPQNNFDIKLYTCSCNQQISYLFSSPVPHETPRKRCKYCKVLDFRHWWPALHGSIRINPAPYQKKGVTLQLASNQKLSKTKENAA